jgi:hypothetical protein
MWAAAAKSKLASLTHKPPKATENHPSLPFSAKPFPQRAQFQRSKSLMVKPLHVEKYSGVVKNLSLPIVKKSDRVTLVVSPTPSPVDLNLVRFDVEYNCPPGWIPH